MEAEPDPIARVTMAELVAGWWVSVTLAAPAVEVRKHQAVFLAVMASSARVVWGSGGEEEVAADGTAVQAAVGSVGAVAHHIRQAPTTLTRQATSMVMAM